MPMYIKYPKVKYFFIKSVTLLNIMKHSDAVKKMGVSSSWYYRMKNHK